MEKVKKMFLAVRELIDFDRIEWVELIDFDRELIDFFMMRE